MYQMFRNNQMHSRDKFLQQVYIRWSSALTAPPSQIHEPGNRTPLYRWDRIYVFLLAIFPASNPEKKGEYTPLLAHNLFSIFL